MKIILGISAYFHDSAAALLIDGEIIACAQEERFSRNKGDYSFPLMAIKYCIKEANIKIPIGIANIIPSIRSSIPPCPGNKSLVFLTLAFLFKKEINKSPI